MHATRGEEAAAKVKYSDGSGDGLVGTQENGELLAAAEGRFDVFVTTDKNLRYQQNLQGRQLAVLLLPSNQVPIVERLITHIEANLMTIQAGDFVAIPLP